MQDRAGFDPAITTVIVSGIFSLLAVVLALIWKYGPSRKSSFDKKFCGIVVKYMRRIDRRLKIIAKHDESDPK